MNDYLKVQGHDEFVRDVRTGAIINTSPVARKKSFSNEFKTVIEDINNLKLELKEIKSLLKQLVQHN